MSNASHKGRKAHNIAQFFHGMGEESRPTWGVDTLPSQRVPQKILKKSISLYYTTGVPVFPYYSKQDDKHWTRQPLTAEFFTVDQTK